MKRIETRQSPATLQRGEVRAAPGQTKTGLIPIRNVPLVQLQPAPENDQVYRPVRLDDPEIRQLAESIRRYGLREPLVISADGYILSGHRRHAAARLAGLREVPCRVEPLSRATNAQGFLRLLVEYNRQRSKSLDEQLREVVVACSPEDAHRQLVQHRARQSQIGAETMELELDVAKGRARLSDAKRPFLAAILRVISELRPFWPLSDRQIHYQLLNSCPLIHASKPDSRYRNTLRCYKRLVDVLTRGRLSGEIPWDSIADPTRPVTLWGVNCGPQSFIQNQLQGLLAGYWRDLMQSQLNHVEIVGEKNTILPIIRPVAADYTIPLTIGRGFCSLPPRRAMAERFRRSGREKLVILIISDHDPDGEIIAQSFIRSMVSDFGIDRWRVDGVKVALTDDQVERFELPAMMTAKTSSANYQRFVAKYGEQVHELEALRPTDLQQLLRDAINSVIDVDAFNHELDREKQDAAFLEKGRQRIRAALSGILAARGESRLLTDDV